ncbi:MAG TPA: protein-L-isoaspartate(D-aspartate) O-methyltransferase [Pseudolabrys sp.]
MNAEYFEEQRRDMVAAVRAITDQMAAQVGKTALDERVLRAMARVPRHEFVPVEVQSYAYLNRPIPIGFDKTISQPLMVAVMTDLLELKPDDVLLEIGTGLGYQAAVLAELAGRVYSVEIIDELAQRAIQRLKRQGYTNVEVRVGNGYAGWPKHAPFDKVIVTAAPDLIPPPLINQLRAGGRMVIPVGLPGAEKDLNGRGRSRLSKGRTLLWKESSQKARRAIPRHAERHLLRGEEDPRHASQDGEGGACARAKKGLRQAQN